MGHYESKGCIWEKGEIPACAYCGKKAKRETNTSGIYICDTARCARYHVEAEFYPIKFVRD